MQGLRPVDIRLVHEELQERIKEYILVNKLKPDDPLPTENQLAEQLHVSRSVVREALRSLESLGVVYSRRGEGRYVSRFNLDPILQNLGYSMLFDTEDVREILEIRERLEAGFIDVAIAAIDQASLDKLQQLVTQMRRKAADQERFLEEDLTFHRIIYLQVGNRLLIKLLDVFWDVYRGLNDQSLHIVRDLAAEAENHARILEAIAAKDSDLARQRLLEHFDGIKERLRSARLRLHDSLDKE